MNNTNHPTAPQDTFLNSTYFIIPIWFDDYGKLTGKLAADTSKWKKNTLSMPYLLSYANRIAVSDNLFCQYSLLHPEELHPEIKRDSLLRMVSRKPERATEVPLMEDFLDHFQLAEVLLSVFETGIGFFEFKVEYGKLPIDSIIDFSYLFKNMRNKQYYKGKFLDDLALELLPAGVEVTPFFYCTDELKHDCLCYHMIKLQPEEADEHMIPKRLYHLGRSYSSTFSFDEKSDTGDNSRYDFRYSPYGNDHWSGSQEALANVNYERGDDSENFFLRKYKYAHLTGDYHFLYLMILNQRFAAIRYIEQIVEFGTEDSKELRKLNQRIVRLKTVFSLRVISSDMLFQNVYTRMYDIMDIDNLLHDLQDNEQQVELLQKENSERAEKITGALLAAISVLAVFSALIDAADYFDLFPGFPGPSRWVSLVVVLVVAVLAFVLPMLWHRKKRK